MVTWPNTIAAGLALLPYLVAAFFPGWMRNSSPRLPRALRLSGPAALCVPYALVSLGAGNFQWAWLAVYALLPVAIATLMAQAGALDPEQRGNWRDWLVLLGVGLAVDLRWFEGAWPAHLAVFNKVLLLDAGIYGLLAIRQLNGAGFDLRLRLPDLGVGLREFLLYAPAAILLGLGMGFLHLHALWPSWKQLGGAYGFTFFFIAVPEEVFFRGWIQNLLERRVGRAWSLAITAALFGLSHWNKRTTNFNWQYVLMAALAGIFYGRAWRAQRRVGASAITHATVDTVWSIWLR
jgi:membrane protease YdiL (CAAX protease family)